MRYLASIQAFRIRNKRHFRSLFVGGSSLRERERAARERLFFASLIVCVIDDIGRHNEFSSRFGMQDDFDISGQMI
jgi:hypothetical protein